MDMHLPLVVRVPVSCGRTFALIDEPDLDRPFLVTLRDGEIRQVRIASHRWSLAGGSEKWMYASLQVGSKRIGNRVRIYMHRLIVGATRREQTVDHINDQCLDNRRSNLRILTNAENVRRMRPRPGFTSRFRGVDRLPDGRWRAQVQCDGRKHPLGVFGSELEAAERYDRAALKLFGSTARLNSELLSTQESA